MSTCNISTLQSQACSNHFNALDQKTAQGILLQLLCEIKSNSTQITHGTGSPSDPPSNASIDTIYFDTSTGTGWFWNSDTQTWQINFTGTVI